MHVASPPSRGWPPPGAAAAAPIGGSTRSSRSCLLQGMGKNAGAAVHGWHGCLTGLQAGLPGGAGCACSPRRRPPGPAPARLSGADRAPQWRSVTTSLLDAGELLAQGGTRPALVGAASPQRQRVAEALQHGHARGAERLQQRASFGRARWEATAGRGGRLSCVVQRAASASKQSARDLAD